MLDRDKRKVEAGKFSHLTTPEAASVDHPDVAKIAFLTNNWISQLHLLVVTVPSPVCTSQPPPTLGSRPSTWEREEHISRGSN